MSWSFVCRGWKIPWHFVKIAGCVCVLVFIHRWLDLDKERQWSVNTTDIYWNLGEPHHKEWILLYVNFKNKFIWIKIVIPFLSIFQSLCAVAFPHLASLRLPSFYQAMTLCLPFSFFAFSLHIVAYLSCYFSKYPHQPIACSKPWCSPSPSLGLVRTMQIPKGIYTTHVIVSFAEGGNIKITSASL